MNKQFMVVRNHTNAMLETKGSNLLFPHSCDALAFFKYGSAKYTVWLMTEKSSLWLQINC